MSLIDQLREAAAAVPPSHIPAPAELLPIIGALIVYTEHGDAFFDAAAEAEAADDAEGRRAPIDNLLAPPEQEEATPVPIASPPAGATTGTDADALRAENAQLRQEVQNLIAASSRTTVDTTPTPAEPPAPAPTPTPTPAGNEGQVT